MRHSRQFRVNLDEINWPFCFVHMAIKQSWPESWLCIRALPVHPLTPECIGDSRISIDNFGKVLIFQGKCRGCMHCIVIAVSFIVMPPKDFRASQWLRLSCCCAMEELNSHAQHIHIIHSSKLSVSWGTLTQPTILTSEWSSRKQSSKRFQGSRSFGSAGVISLEQSSHQDFGSSTVFSGGCLLFYSFQI